MEIERVTQRITYTVTINREPGEAWPVLRERHMQIFCEQIEIRVTLEDGESWECGPAGVTRGYRLRTDGTRGTAVGTGHAFSGPGNAEMRFVTELDTRAIAAAKDTHAAWLRRVYGLRPAS